MATRAAWWTSNGVRSWTTSSRPAPRTVRWESNRLTVMIMVTTTFMPMQPWPLTSRWESGRFLTAVWGGTWPKLWLILIGHSRRAGAYRVASHLQRHPAQRRIRLQGNHGSDLNNKPMMLQILIWYPGGGRGCEDDWQAIQTSSSVCPSTLMEVYWPPAVRILKTAHYWSTFRESSSGESRRHVPQTICMWKSVFKFFL